MTEEKKPKRLREWFKKHSYKVPYLAIGVCAVLAGVSAAMKDNWTAVFWTYTASFCAGGWFMATETNETMIRANRLLERRADVAEHNAAAVILMLNEIRAKHPDFQHFPPLPIPEHLSGLAAEILAELDEQRRG